MIIPEIPSSKEKVVIPCMKCTFEDLTPEQIEQIQKPALDAAEVANDAAVEANSAAQSANDAADKANQAAESADGKYFLEDGYVRRIGDIMYKVKVGYDTN